MEVTDLRLDGRGTLEVGPGFDKSFKRDTALCTPTTDVCSIWFRPTKIP